MAEPHWEASLQHDRVASEPDIGSFVRLGPLGSSLVPADRPRILLIDELEKADLDLPNDLLTVFSAAPDPPCTVSGRWDFAS